MYDCCHSGTVSDLPYTRDLVPPGEEVQARFIEPPADIARAIAEAASAAKGTSRNIAGPDTAEDMSGSKKHVMTISGCRDNQTSADATINGQRQGAMTWALLESLKEGGQNGEAYMFRYENLLTAMRKRLKAKRFTQVPGIATCDKAMFRKYYLNNKPNSGKCGGYPA